MRKPMTACFFFLLSFGLLFQPQAQGAAPASRNVILSTTTSTQDSGLLDVLIGVNGGAPLLLRNSSGAGNRWVGLKLQGVKANRDAVGARITWSVNGVKRSRLKNGAGSYLASHDPREVLGLGPATKLDWVEIRWPGPSRVVERFSGLAIDRYHTIVEGEGRGV